MKHLLAAALLAAGLAASLAPAAQAAPLCGPLAGVNCWNGSHYCRVWVSPTLAPPDGVCIHTD